MCVQAGRECRPVLWRRLVLTCCAVLGLLCAPGMATVCPVDHYPFYPDAVSAGTCTACPASSFSPAGSSNLYDCTCGKGRAPKFGGYVSGDTSVKLYTTWPYNLTTSMAGSYDEFMWSLGYTWQTAGQKLWPYDLATLSALSGQSISVCGRAEWFPICPGNSFSVCPGLVPGYGAICDYEHSAGGVEAPNTFQDDDAQVFCRHLGLTGGVDPTGFAGYAKFSGSYPWSGSWTTANLSCAGSESSLDACPRNLTQTAIYVGAGNPGAGSIHRDCTGVLSSAETWPSDVCCAGDVSNVAISFGDPASCTPCNPGSYKATNGTAACAKCPIGKFSDGQEACPTWSGYANSNWLTGCGATACLDCPPGTYTIVEGTAREAVRGDEPICLPSPTTTSTTAAPAITTSTTAAPAITTTPTPIAMTTTPTPTHAHSPPTATNVSVCKSGHYLSVGVCTPCPSRSNAMLGSTSCQCDDGFKRLDAIDIHQGCFLRIPRVDNDPRLSGRVFIVRLSVQTTTNASAEYVEQWLQLRTSEFFTIDPGNVSVTARNARRESSAVLIAQCDAILFENQAQFKETLVESSSIFEQFLSWSAGRQDWRMMVRVLSMQVTCGQGHSLEPGTSNSSSAGAASNVSSDVCTPCSIGFYKEALDDSACLACPKFASTNLSGTMDASFCKGSQFVSIEDAKEAARAVSTAVGVVVGTNVALAVGTAVASSVSSAVAASSGGAVGGAVGGSGGAATGEAAGSSSSSSSGGTLTLVTQVQFLNQIGRIGGSEASESMSSYSDGFKWANYDLGLSLPGRSASNATTRRKHQRNRRTAHKAGASQIGQGQASTGGSGEVYMNQYAQDGGDEASCDFSQLLPPTEILITCLVVMSSVFIARQLLVLAFKHCLHKDQPSSLLFGAWEGPVALTQYMALCDSAIEAAALSCPVYIALGVLVLLLLPINFAIFAALRVRRHVNEGRLSYVQNPTPSFSVLKDKVSRTKGTIGKIIIAHAWYGGAFVKGYWTDTKVSAHWGFLISEICAGVWFFSIWILVKKFLISIVLTTLDGRPNTWCAIVLQAVDCVLLLFTRPYNNRQTEFTEAFGSITNLLSFTAISLPVIAGPDFKLPSWLGDYTNMILASTATIISVFVSVLTPLVQLIGFAFKLGFMVASKLGCVVSSHAAGVAAEVADEAGGNVQEELQGQAKDYYDPDKGKDDGAAEHESQDTQSSSSSTGSSASASPASASASSSSFPSSASSWSLEGDPAATSAMGAQAAIAARTGAAATIDVRGNREAGADVSATMQLKLHRSFNRQPTIEHPSLPAPPGASASLHGRVDLEHSIWVLPDLTHLEALPPRRSQFSTSLPSMHTSPPGSFVRMAANNRSTPPTPLQSARILRGTARGGGGGRVASEHAHMSGDGIRTDQ